jgi:hypothetical protein
MVSRLLRCDREIDYKGSKVVTCTCDEALRLNLFLVCQMPIQHRHRSLLYASVLRCTAKLLLLLPSFLLLSKTWSFDMQSFSLHLACFELFFVIPFSRSARFLLGPKRERYGCCKLEPMRRCGRIESCWRELRP